MAAKKVQIIKDFYNRIIGYIDIDDYGNKTIMDDGRRILGYYKKDLDVTTNAGGRILAKGDYGAGLIDLTKFDKKYNTKRKA